jgi:hypothetical protein
MSALEDLTQGGLLRDPEELRSRLAEFSLNRPSGRPTRSPSEHQADPPAEAESVYWTVALSTDAQQIRRDIWADGVPWDSAGEGWECEGIIWPTWPATPADETAATGAPLASVHKRWSKASNRLRDSAKWMAAALGAALATVVGTSPLTAMRQHHPPTIAITVGLMGLIFLSITLFLVLQVMRPQTVSYANIQNAPNRRGFRQPPLSKWRETVESQGDLYLPCGVNGLTSLRQSMIIEEATLMALARARAHAHDEQMSKRLGEAQTARTARLLELRTAAAQIVTIGEFYKLRARSTRATYGGILCALIGSASIIAAFALPFS